MSEIIDAKWLACPQPVILTKRALDSCNEVTILVDNVAACENVKRFAFKSGCIVDVMEESGGIFRLHIKKQQDKSKEADSIAEFLPARAGSPSIIGQTVFVISSDVMGQGNDELGAILMKAFIHIAAELDCPPAVLIFYNTGVRLTAYDSDVIDDLKALEGKGVELMICGTCVNYFNLGDKLGAGKVSNMYDIADVLSAAGRIVRP
jgi:selenium metabolism protein YedF